MAPVFAQQFEYGNKVVIHQPVYEDLYIAGGNVTVDAPVHGDLVIAGGTVTVQDSVTHDILVAGGTVIIKGYAGDDIRCAGGRLYISNRTAGDLLVTGGRVQVNRSARVEGSLLASGGDLMIAGTVKGPMRVRANRMAFNGAAAGPAVLMARELSIGRRAAFQQDVRYWNRKGHPDFSHAMRHGTAVRDESLRMASARWHYLGFTSAVFLLWYLAAALIFIILLEYLFTRIMQKAGSSLLRYPLPYTGYGLLFIIVMPVLIFFILLTMIGIPLALLLLLGYLVILMLSSNISAVVLANWLNSRYHRHWSRWALIWVAMGVFIVLKMITLIPYIGWLLMLIAVGLSFGALLHSIRRRKRMSMT